VTIRLAIALAAACAAFAATGAAAQASAAAAPVPCVLAGDSAGGDSAGAHPDVLIRASVSIAELRFESDPAARVRVGGCPDGRGLRVVERRNLPERVQPGVTYRDVYVAVEIVGRLEAACIAALAGDAALAGAVGGGGCASAAADSARAPPRP
jgi:hypothetical protein